MGRAAGSGSAAGSGIWGALRVRGGPGPACAAVYSRRRFASIQYSLCLFILCVYGYPPGYPRNRIKDSSILSRETSFVLPRLALPGRERRAALPAVRLNSFLAGESSAGGNSSRSVPPRPFNYCRRSWKPGRTALEAGESGDCQRSNLKNSAGVLQLWMDEKSPCFRLCHHSQVCRQL